MVARTAQRARLVVEDGSPGTRPLLKWVGGKRQLLPHLRAHAPERYGRYFEPFVGGGALFFALGPRRARLSDVNERLIRAYTGVRDHVERVIELLGGYEPNKPFFLETREVDIDARDDAQVAAWVIYLNRTAYNGLYRVNSRNIFNVPFGDYARPNFQDPERLRACAAALRGVDLVTEDFEAAVKGARRGDFVYFDPPYVPLSATSYFTSYASGGFGPDAQRRLRDVALRLKKRGVHVLLSNSSAPEVRELYADGFELIPVSATRRVNCKPGGRGAVTEYVIR